jgi:hypothetical protein
VNRRFLAVLAALALLLLAGLLWLAWQLRPWERIQHGAPMGPVGSDIDRKSVV